METLVIIIGIVALMAIAIAVSIIIRMRNRDLELKLEAHVGQMMLRQREELTKSNNEQIAMILQPLKERIEAFTRQSMQTRMESAASSKLLTDRLDKLMQLNVSIGEEARNLTNALRNNSKVQGDWGEMILLQTLEAAGLKRDITFTVQLTRDSSGNAIRDDEGILRRPDVLIHLPGNRKVIVDSKVSLTSFAEYAEAQSEEARQQASRRLVRSVRNHIDELSAKNYPKLIKGSAEQVLMFVPIEGAYFLALETESGLREYALRKHISIVTPTHILAVVQLVAEMWRVEDQNKNAAEIARLGGLIYDKIVGFAKDFETIQRSLKAAEEAYERSLKSLTQGPTSVMARTKKLKDLGAKTEKRLPESITDSINLNSDSETA